MTAGFQIKNAQGKIVIDSNDPVLQALDKGTLNLADHFGSSTYSGFCNETCTSTWGDGVDCNRGYLPRNAEGEFYFFELTQGRRVHVLQSSSQIEVYSNHQSVRWVRCRFARYITPEPNINHGIECRDAQGRLTYSTGARLLSLNGTLQNHTGPGIWVAPATEFIYEHPDYDGIPYITGVYRDSNGLIAQGWTCGSQYQHITGYRYDGQRIRGLVADINYSVV